MSKILTMTSINGLAKSVSYFYTKAKDKGVFLVQIYYENCQLESEMYQNPLDPNMWGYKNHYYPKVNRW